MTTTLEGIRRPVVSALRAYVTDPDAAAHGKEAAGHLVATRALFTDKRGRADPAGRSKAWRRRPASTRKRAPRGSEAAGVRYHVGNALRELYSPETLADYGLIAESPRAKEAERHEREREVLTAVSGVT